MAGVTEIYVCRNGQALKDGRLELSHTIATKEEAQADAVRRCRSDGTVDRIAYYRVAESGAFRNFLTYANPAAKGTRAAKPKHAPRPRTRPPSPPPSRQGSWWSRFRSALGLGAQE